METVLSWIPSSTTNVAAATFIISKYKLGQKVPYQLQDYHQSFSYRMNKHTPRIPIHPLYGISEWRDIIYDYPGTSLDQRLGKKDSCTLPKEICILPFPYQEVLLQGETKQLRLYEERFIQLFKTCINEHCSICAMGMIASSGIIQTVPIIEIEAYNNNLVNEFGIFVTIRVVGRAKLLDIVQQTPYMKAVCIEITDTLPPNLEL
jgi:hypothetical protein